MESLARPRYPDASMHGVFEEPVNLFCSSCEAGAGSHEEATGAGVPQIQRGTAARGA